MDETELEMRQLAAESRIGNKDILRLMRKRETEKYLRMEDKKMGPSIETVRIRGVRHGYYHIKFKTQEWQEWWGEGFYRRDGNDTPNSPEPKVAELQELFATVKRKHQQNQQQWRRDLTEYLLGMEGKNIPAPRFTTEYLPFWLTFEIPFKTAEYQKWWDMELRDYDVDDDDLPASSFSPFEVKFLEVARKIHMAIIERRLDAARSMIKNELSAMVEEDRKSIRKSIASNVYSHISNHKL